MTTKTTVEITLPVAIMASDYHQFPALESTMRAIGIKGAKIVEVGCNGDYYGVLYVGRRPSAKEQFDLVRKRFKVDLEDECDEDLY